MSQLSKEELEELEERDRISQDVREARQRKDLLELVGELRKIPLYAQKLAAVSLPEEGSLHELLNALPFTKQSDVEAGNTALKQWGNPKFARIHASSGSTGRPRLAGYSWNDLKIWSDLCARSLLYGKVQPGWLVQISYGYGLFTGGLGIHYGAERLGCGVIPASTGSTLEQIRLLETLKPHVLACTPSYAQLLMDELGESSNARQSLRLLLLGAEPWTEEMRKELENMAPNATVLDIYGLSEVIGPGVACECDKHAGLHVFEDQFLIEVVDPNPNKENPARVPPNHLGELVITTLQKSAMPLLRYRTGDLTRVLDSRDICQCGRTTVRISKILGRTDSMVIVRGKNFYVNGIERVLSQIKELSMYYEASVHRPGRLDELELKVECQDPGRTHYKTIEDRTREALRIEYEMNIEVTVYPPGTLPRSDGGKSQRVIDRRERP